MPLTEKGYLPRVIDDELRRALSTFGAVCVQGPRWCGKTWTSLNQAESVTFIGDPAGSFQNRRLAELDPTLVLFGEPPHLVDEWQEVPGIWDAVRLDVDCSRLRGRFILTGSSTPKRRGVMHSGVGRICTLDMRPMSLFESGDSSGDVSLGEVFDAPPRSIPLRQPTIAELAQLIVRGGWLESLGRSEEEARMLARSYLKLTVEDDASRIDGVRRDPQKLMALLRSLARNESTLAKNSTLRKDMLKFDDETIAPDTVADYLLVLRRLFVVWEQPAYSPHLRSSIRVGKSPKRHLADPSLDAAALGVDSRGLIADLNTYGFLFEGMCERDLAIYAQSLDAKLYHYRDASNREIDAVVELRDGRWGAFEIKVGANQIDEAAKGLLRMKRLMEEDSTAQPPSILVVICGMSAAAYTRPDGVIVVPPTALRP